MTRQIQIGLLLIAVAIVSIILYSQQGEANGSHTAYDYGWTGSPEPVVTEVTVDGERIYELPATGAGTTAGH